MKNRTYNVFSRIVSTVKKSVARMPQAWALRNSDQVGPSRRGAGPSPSARRILLMVVAPTRTPTLRSSPWIRTWPHIGFSMARRRTSARTSGSMGRRPGFLLDLWVHFRRTSSRCHRSSVWGVTRNEFHLSLGRRRAAAARKARSTGRSLGRRTCRRRTLSWCRSTAFSISSTCPRLGHGITPKRLRNNRWIQGHDHGAGMLPDGAVRGVLEFRHPSGGKTCPVRAEGTPKDLCGRRDIWGSKQALPAATPHPARRKAPSQRPLSAAEADGNRTRLGALAPTPVLKTGGPTRRPDASEAEDTT